MKTSIYGYFSDWTWAQQFLLGNLRFGSLAYYHSIEDESRKDESEGVLRHNHGGKLRINNLTQDRQMDLEGFSFVSQARSDEIFISSLSRSLNRHLWSKFLAVTCVEIFRVPSFIAQVRESIFDDFELHFKRVEYADELVIPRHNWGVPENVASRKSPSFESETESRLILGRKEVFRAENVGLSLVQGHLEAINVGREPSSMTISVGDLSAHCKVHYQVP
jgi:hypothetical protein